MSDCIFCKIAGGEIPSNTVFENDDFRVILDLNPANGGHCLVIPKSHAANIFELDEDLCAKGFSIAKKIAAALKSAFNCDGVNIIQNNGDAAGQTVNHFHIHVIPRYTNDKVVIAFNSNKMSDDEFKKIKEEIKAKL